MHTSAGHRLTGRCLHGAPDAYVPEAGFSRSTLDISRSFHPRASVKSSFGGPSTAAAAAAAVAAVDVAKLGGNDSSRGYNPRFGDSCRVSTPGSGSGSVQKADAGDEEEEFAVENCVYNRA